MTYLFDPPPVVTLPIQGSDKLFPVHRIYCVGRNYAEHTREMGHDPDKEPPFFFMKTPDALVTDGRFPYPPATNDVHWEIEMVVALKSGGVNIPRAEAMGRTGRDWLLSNATFEVMLARYLDVYANGRA